MHAQQLSQRIPALLRRPRTILLLILVLALLARLPNLGTHLPGTDEALTLRVAAGLPWGTASFDYFHPPLFFLIVQTALLAADPVLLLRGLMVAAGLLTVLLAYLLGRDLRAPAVGLLAAFLLAVNPMSVIYSQHGRPYILFSLFFLASSWLLFRFLVRQERRALYPLPFLYALAFYNHYLAAFFILAHAATALWILRRRFLPVAGILVVTILLISPILLHFLANVRDLSASPQTWMGSIDPQNIPYPLYKMAVMADLSTTLASFPPVVILFPLAGLLALAGLWSLRQQKAAVFMGGVFLLPFLLYYAASFYIVVYFFRYLSFLLPAFLLLVAVGLERCPPRLRWPFLAVLVAGWAVVLQFYYAVSVLGDWGIAIAV